MSRQSSLNSFFAPRIQSDLENTTNSVLTERQNFELSKFTASTVTPPIKESVVIAKITEKNEDVLKEDDVMELEVKTNEEVDNGVEAKSPENIGSDTYIRSQSVTEEADVKSSSSDINSDITLSSYELLREENIRRNAEFLASLGFNSIKPKASVPVSSSKNIGKKRCRSPVAKQAPTRRSSRVANVPVEKIQIQNEASDSESCSSSEEEEDLDDSDVLRYVMSTATASLTNEVSEALSSTKEVCDIDPTGFQLLSEEPLFCEDLPAIYSMDIHNSYPLFMAAGKGGYVALHRTSFFDTSLLPKAASDNESRSLLCSFRAHTRWVSTAKFVYAGESSDENTSLKVLTASDDATIKLWDLSKNYHSKRVNALCPPCIMTSKDIHDRGIFALDVSNENVLTGSKDKSVAISVIESSGTSLKLKSRYCLHSGVVKSVSWSNTSDAKHYAPIIFASGGQDRRVCVKDTRIGGDTAQVELENCHEGGVHTVLFNPYGGENMLLTAGMDPVIKVFDLRYLTNTSSTLLSGESAMVHKPIYEFRGHANSCVKKFKSIISPCWLSQNTLVSAGQQSSQLSIYNTSTGKTVSRGELEVETSGCVVAKRGKKTIVFAANKAEVQCLDAIKTS